MQKILYLIRKEFLQVFRDKAMLGIIFVAPIIQLILLGYAITTDVKNVKLLFCDKDCSKVSRMIAQSFVNSPHFNVSLARGSYYSIESLLRNGDYDGAVVIPEGFEKDLGRRSGEIQILIDGQNANKSTVVLSYCKGIILNTMKGYRDQNSAGGIVPVINIRYNPLLRSVNYMIPGIVGILLTIMTMVLTSLAIVREKEIGTLEQLMVTPLKSWQIIAGKSVPFVIISLIAMGIELGVGILWFKIPVRGSIFTLLVASICFLSATLGMGIFVSTLVSTQQQALFICWFLTVVFVLLGGLFFPLENMPDWVQKMTIINPLKYFIRVAREVTLKGVGIRLIADDLRALIIIGATIFTFSSLRFHKRIS